MGFAMGTIRYIIFFINFLLAIAGLAIVIIGGLIAASDDPTDEVTKGMVFMPALCFTILGAFIFVLAFFGCCGAIRENQCMVYTYAVLLGVLFLFQAILVIVVYIYKGDAKDAVDKIVTEKYLNYTKNAEDNDNVNAIQRAFSCCGTVDNQTPWKQLNISAPDTCFPEDDREKAPFTTGCIANIRTVVDKVFSKMGRVAIATGIAEIVGVVFAICLANSIRRSEMRGYA